MGNLKIDRATVKKFTDNVGAKNIFIIGDVGVDRYTEGEASRISDEAPVPIVSVTGKKEKLGLAANVADNIAAIGAGSSVSSLIGRDENTDTLLRLLAEKEIKHDYLFSHETRKTIVKERVVANNQQVVRIDHEVKNPLTAEAEQFYWNKISSALGDFDAIILEDYGKGLISSSLAKKVIDLARQKNIFIAVDPPSTAHDIEMYANASLITPNQRETERMLKTDLQSKADIENAGSQLINGLSLTYAVVTQGKNGMSIFQKDSSPLHIPTLAREVFDVSGAGDTVISVITLAITCGLSIVDAAKLATFAAAVVVGKPGTATVTVDEILAFIKESDNLI